MAEFVAVPHISSTIGDVTLCRLCWPALGVCTLPVFRVLWRGNTKKPQRLVVVSSDSVTSCLRLKAPVEEKNSKWLSNYTGKHLVLKIFRIHLHLGNLHALTIMSSVVYINLQCVFELLLWNLYVLVYHCIVSVIFFHFVIQHSRLGRS